MPKQGLGIQIELILIKPKRPEYIGREAVRLTMTIAGLTRGEVVELTSPVRAGFKDNFDTESAAGEPWPALAARTLREREEEKTPYPEYPMLVRSGKYRDSWLDPGNPLNLLEWEEARSLSSTGVEVGENKVTIHVGSKHKHVAKLSGGEWSEAQAMVTAFEQMGDVAPAAMMAGVVPPRPVHGIRDVYEDLLDAFMEDILTRKAETIR